MRQVSDGIRSAALAAAVAGAARTRRYGSWYVAEHRFRVMRSYAQTVLFTAVGSPLVYLYAMGVGLASLVDGNLGDNAVNGVSYLAFLAPALLASSAIAVASEEFTYPIMLGFKWNPTFFAMNASSIQPGQIINGIVISVAARMVLTCTIFYVFMLVFGAAPGPLGFVAVPVALLTGLAFGALVMAYTATLKDDTGQLAMVQRFVILPMTLFSGTFFPLDVLPRYLQWIGWISPLWHGTELSRVFAYGMPEPIWLSLVHVLYLAVLLAVGWVWARRLTVRRLNK
ncbi:ABC transporter permease [Cryobacterium sp. TMT1-3]|uniref:Transport permease protein n=1 Tax=Cryobacterium luteum TaxID=1424661 RepID=A0A1H8J0Q9_9MICO|nr:MULTISPECIES: ABC transporter permease [Cryobacterium]TFB93259.1 ABC transporter permease [Cryobacterium luteum]TFC28700.1 ABC transporter permease [Cryobacterium sp. TMT1-3]SEN73876.1 lipooligosaccharide transport system permease protein [Cryobacterium luteum]